MSETFDLEDALQAAINRAKAGGAPKGASDSCGVCGRFKSRPCADFDPPEDCESEVSA